MDLSRRDLLALSGLAFAGTTLAPPGLHAQSPKRGGTLTLRVWDPPHFDPYLIVAFKTQVVYSFTHSRLLKHKAGPSVQLAASSWKAIWPNRGASPTRPLTCSGCGRACGGTRSRPPTDGSSRPTTSSTQWSASEI